MESDEDESDDNGEEIDELEDDSSLDGGSDNDPVQGTKRNGRKRPRPSGLPERETRTSTRKKPRREENTNGDTSRPTNGRPAAKRGRPPAPPDTVHLKGSKGRPTKFWYFEEGDGAPAKRPEMLDDPDKMLRKRPRKSDKGSGDASERATSLDVAFAKVDVQSNGTSHE